MNQSQQQITNSFAHLQHQRNFNYNKLTNFNSHTPEYCQSKQLLKALGLKKNLTYEQSQEQISANLERHLKIFANIDDAFSSKNIIICNQCNVCYQRFSQNYNLKNWKFFLDIDKDYAQLIIHKIYDAYKNLSELIDQILRCRCKQQQQQQECMKKQYIAAAENMLRFNTDSKTHLNEKTMVNQITRYIQSKNMIKTRKSLCQKCQKSIIWANIQTDYKRLQMNKETADGKQEIRRAYDELKSFFLKLKDNNCKQYKIQIVQLSEFSNNSQHDKQKKSQQTQNQLKRQNYLSQSEQKYSSSKEQDKNTNLSYSAIQKKKMEGKGWQILEKQNKKQFKNTGWMLLYGIGLFWIWQHCCPSNVFFKQKKKSTKMVKNSFKE